jgi:hypothetical protein
VTIDVRLQPEQGVAKKLIEGEENEKRGVI